MDEETWHGVVRNRRRKVKMILGEEISTMNFDFDFEGKLLLQLSFFSFCFSILDEIKWILKLNLDRTKVLILRSGYMFINVRKKERKKNIVHVNQFYN